MHKVRFITLLQTVVEVEEFVISTFDFFFLIVVGVCVLDLSLWNLFDFVSVFSSSLCSGLRAFRFLGRFFPREIITSHRGVAGQLPLPDS